MATSLTTDPIEWITGALGKTLGSILLFYFSFAAGSFAVLYPDPIIFLFCLMSIPIFIFTGWGLLFIPLIIWINWALLFDETNKYVLLSLNMLSGAFLSATQFNDFAFSWYTLPMLLPPVLILFSAWFPPVKNSFHTLKRLKYKGIHFDNPE